MHRPLYVCKQNKVVHDACSCRLPLCSCAINSNDGHACIAGTPVACPQGGNRRALSARPYCRMQLLTLPL